MSEEVIDEVEGLLRDEVYGANAASSFTESKFANISMLIEKARINGVISDVLKLCTEKLEQNPASIVSLYITGIVSLQNHKLETSALSHLIDIFNKNKKVEIVEYLCLDILKIDESNKFALTTLAEFYDKTGNEKKWEYFEKIVKIDMTRADIAKKLAIHYNDDVKDKDKAIEYYKKAVLRFIVAKNSSEVSALWKILVKMVDDLSKEADFFALAKRKVTDNFGAEKTITLSHDLYDRYKEDEDKAQETRENNGTNGEAVATESNDATGKKSKRKSEGNWDSAIDILKDILTIDNSDTWARNELVSCYRKKYKNHSHLEDYIINSNLNTNYRNVFEAINDFEKHIAFDRGNFVFHHTWGVGKIIKVTKDSIDVNFGAKLGKKSMKLAMAINALTPLDKYHIWVYKATMSRDKLAKRVKDHKLWALRVIIKSFDNKCDLKRIKSELVPSVMDQKDWGAWHTEAKKILTENASFAVDPTNISLYTVRTYVLGKTEKLTNEFKAQKLFFSRVDVVMRYLSSDETDKDSENFADMVNYFLGFLNTLDDSRETTRLGATGGPSEQVVASYLVMQKITEVATQFTMPTKYTFSDIYKKIANPRQIFDSLKDTKNTSLRDDFIHNVRTLVNWADEYIRLFPNVLDKKIIEELVNDGYTDKVVSFITTCYDNPKDYRDSIIYLFKECRNDEWYKKANIPYEKQLIALIDIIDVTFREISNHLNTVNNKKTNKGATDLLFNSKDSKDGLLLKYMATVDEVTVVKLYTMLDDIIDLSGDYKAILRNKILEKYPNVKFNTLQEKKTAAKGMMVTAQKLKEKKEYLEQLQKVEVPKNAKEIEEARARGDLKENAEYKAAKEYQHKLNSDIARLQAEINRAVVFDPTTATTAFVSFSTVVTLYNKDKQKDEVYTILGPWESDPDNGVISYMAPFGNALMDSKVGDDVEFAINEYKSHYTVKDIKIA